MYRYEIQRGDNGYVAYIYDDVDLLIIQPFSPETGKPFATEEEAKAWSEDFISLMIPPDVVEEPTEEGAEPVPTDTTTTTKSTENTTTESNKATTTEATTKNTGTEPSQTTTTTEFTTKSSETSTTTDTNT